MTVWESFGNEIIKMRLEGWTLQMIGEKYGVTREGIRRILKSKKLQLQLPLSEENVIHQLHISKHYLQQLRQKGLIKPARMGHIFRYTPDDLDAVRNWLEHRVCRLCGNQLEKCCRLYCRQCGPLRGRNHYRHSSVEQKKRHNLTCAKWQQEHPEQYQVIQQRALQKYRVKEKATRLQSARYLVIKGSYLPIGTEFQAVDSSPRVLTLKGGTQIPVTCVRRIK